MTTITINVYADPMSQADVERLRATLRNELSIAEKVMIYCPVPVVDNAKVLIKQAWPVMLLIGVGWCIGVALLTSAVLEQSVADAIAGGSLIIGALVALGFINLTFFIATGFERIDKSLGKSRAPATASNEFSR